MKKARLLKEVWLFCVNRILLVGYPPEAASCNTLLFKFDLSVQSHNRHFVHTNGFYHQVVICQVH